MGGAADRQAWATTYLQRCGCPDLPDDEGPVRQGAAEETGFVESLLCLIGLDWDVPDFSTLSRRQFDEATGKTHTLYSLLHTAICRRITNSEGRVNIFNLAKNAGTSVDQIERFYTRFLPLSKEIAKNLPSFGE